MPDLPRAAVWLDPTQVPFVRRSLEGVASIVFAGSPAKGQSSAVAAELGAEPFDDLRAFMAHADVRLLWLATLGEFAALPDPLDAHTLLDAAARGVTIATTEPIPSTPLNLKPGGWSNPGDESPLADRPRLAGANLRYVGLPRLARAWREGQEALAAFGPPRMLQIECWSGRGEGSLAARLLGAMDLIVHVMGEPATINAAYVGDGHDLGIHAPPGETLRDLRGDLSATLRFDDGRTAVLAASSAAGRSSHIITLISGEGRLRFYDDGFEWVAPDGTKRDEQRLARHARGTHSLAETGAVLARESLTQLLADPAGPGPMPLDSVLVLCQTALLSARTGNPESPESIRRMMLV